ncbi:MAG: hypothetical protein U5K37_12445 [Natrialbaceae archaeon]|nr:hypothetical protein [Natrialbaceae archaeon]
MTVGQFSSMYRVLEDELHPTTLISGVIQYSIALEYLEEEIRDSEEAAVAGLNDRLVVALYHIHLPNASRCWDGSAQHGQADNQRDSISRGALWWTRVRSVSRGVVIRSYTLTSIEAEEIVLVEIDEETDDLPRKFNYHRWGSMSPKLCQYIFMINMKVT